MPIARDAVAFLLILSTGACAATGQSRGRQGAAKKPPAGGVVELRVASFDGRDLEGRILIGATVDPLVLDRRLIPWSKIELKKIRSCDTKGRLAYYVWEYRVEPPEPEDVITLPRGYWWGVDVVFQLFDKEKTTEPACFEAELVVKDRYGRIAATKTVQVVRTEKPSGTQDGKTEEQKPPAPSAGAP